MANIPQLLTKEQLIGLIIDSILAKIDNISDLNPGSDLTQLAEAVGQVIYKPYTDQIAMLTALSVDRAVGEALQRLARDKNVPILPALPASGLVNITDLTFKKVQTSIYAGQPAPVGGSAVVYVSDASQFLPSGTLYIGRGTANVEGPLTYDSIVPLAGGTYYQINLNTGTPTAKFHNIGETVIMGQGGNRPVRAGTVVSTPQGSAVSSVNYITTVAATILDGETTVTQVPIVSQQVGTVGNVPRGAIQQVSGLSFNASAFNDQPLSNGRAADSEDDIRQRIKLYEQLKAKGTPQAIKAASIDVVAPDSSARTTSANVVQYAGGPAALIYDDSDINEPKFSGIGVETVVDEAIGGERDLQLRNVPTAQARIVSGQAFPYNIPDLYELSVTISGETTVHQFRSTDFRVPGAATAFEVAASINADATINFLANTYNGGTQVVVFPKDPKVNNIVVNTLATNDANDALQFFADNVAYTLRAYRNDTLLFQDGLLARLSTKPKPSWSTGIIDGDTLTYQVDGTPEVTATFTLTDFQLVNASSTVSASEPIDIWVQVFNNLMPGIVATAEGDVVHFDSNRGFSSKASIVITGGTLRDKIFALGATLTSTGQDSDYTFNRNTSQLSLSTQLVAGESVTIGSPFTRAKLITASLPSGPAASGNVWFVVDGDAQVIANSMRSTTQIEFTRAFVSNTALVRTSNVVTVTTATPHGILVGDHVTIADVTPSSFNGSFQVDSVPTSTSFTYSQTGIDETASIFGTTASGFTTLSGRNSATLAPEAFDNVQAGDWLLVWFNTGDNPGLVANAGFWRVQSVPTPGSVVFNNDSGTNTTWMSSIPISRIVFVRTLAPLQRLSFPSSSLVALASNISQQLVGVNTDILGSKIRISTKTADLTGQILAVAADATGQGLGLTIGTPVNNTTSHLGFNVTDDLAYGFPSFTHSAVTEVLAPNQLQDTTDDYLDLGGDLHDYVEFLDGYDAASLVVVPDSNARRRAFVSNFDPSTDVVSVVIPEYMGADASIVQRADRFFLRKSYQFDSDDKLTTIIDGNASIQTFNLPVARRLVINGNSSPTLTTFSADDKESSVPMNDPSAFGSFSFLDFRIWRQAHAELTDGTYDLMARSADFGPAGNLVRVGIVYPDSIDQTSVSHRVTVSDVINVGLVIPVATARSISWDGTSAFTTSVTTTDGLDEVTYTWRVGTEPDFTVTGSNLAIGDVVIIGAAADFRSGNRGISAKVTNFTSNSFTIQRPTGVAVADAPVFDSISNVGGTVTVVISAGHNIENGDRVGVYGTAESSLGNHPLDGTYIPTVVSPTTFTFKAGAGVPGGVIVSGTHSTNIVTINAPAHGLVVGNFVRISGVSVSAYNGTFRVYAVPSTNQFQYVVLGSSSSIANDGRFDFQSYLAANAGVSIASIGRNSSLVTVVTATPHGFTSGQLVEIAGVTITAWSSSTSYSVGDVVRDTVDSNLYKSLTNSNLNNNPHLSPASWQITTSDMTGTFVVNVADSVTFLYYYWDTTGSSSGSGGNATLFTSQGALARCVGSTSANLAFAEVSTTAQAMVDYAAQNLSGRLQLTNIGSGSAVVDTSTEDQDAGTNYIFGNVVSIRAVNGQRYVDITVDTQVDPGASLSIDVSNSAYDGDYTVLTSVQDGSNWVLRCYSSVYSFTTGNVSGGSGTFTGSYPYIMMQDGDNSVLAQNLASTPNFTAKRAWAMAPAIGEEVRLVAANKDHLVRFWNLLIVSGISNLASVENSKYAEEIQISTDTFGSTGSVQMASSLANDGTVALSTTGSEIDNRLGTFGVPYDLRKGLTQGSWIKLTQTVTQSKQLGFGIGTQVQAFGNGVQLPDTSNGSFQTAVSSSHDYSTVWRVEKHGKFTAFIAVGGTSPALGTNGLKEGDRVRVRNVLPQLYDGVLTYARGRKVRLSNGNRYVATQNVPTGTPPPNGTYWAQYNDWSATTSYSVSGTRFASFEGRLWETASSTPFTNVQPGTDSSLWMPREWSVASEGIYQVVRTYGQNSFWVEGNIEEEITQLLDPANLAFYTYDSVMPGDTLSIAGSILGLGNIGTYTVLDDAADGTTLFPTATRLFTDPIPTATGSYVLLGTNFGQITVIESAPPVLYKRVTSVGPGLEGLAAVIVDTPNLVNKISNSLGAYLTMENKLGFSNDVHYGIDGYKYYTDIMKQLNRVIYGDPTSPIDYPGVRAAGTDVDPKPALIKRIQVSISIRVRIGLSPTEISDRVKAAVAGYVRQLDVGEPVALSEIVTAAGKVNGVVAVAIISPTYSSSEDQIAVAADQTARVVNPQEDVLVSIVGQTTT